MRLVRTWCKRRTSVKESFEIPRLMRSRPSVGGARGQVLQIVKVEFPG